MDLLAQVKKLLSVETSLQFGTKNFGQTLKEIFPDFEWSSTNDESGCALHFFETNTTDSTKPVDLLIYLNVDTNNLSSLALWTETDCDPLNVTLKKDRIYGLGACHEKASLIPVLNALKEVNTSKNILFVAGYGREMNMIGAKRTVAELVRGSSTNKVNKREVKQTLVLHPTESKFLTSSVGRTKIEVFFPFSDQEKKLKDEHDLKENIFSQSKIFNKNDRNSLDEDVIFKALRSFSLLPTGTLLLDFSGGTGTITEAQSVYFEIDVAPTLENSMVSRLDCFSKILNIVNAALLEKFRFKKPAKALHIGKASATTEGVYFYGYNLIPPFVSVSELNSWFKKFSDEVESQGGVVKVRDTKKPYCKKMTEKNDPGALEVTEATIFSRYFSDVCIFGVGKEGLSQRPNESLSLSELTESKKLLIDFLKKSLEH